jgi:hypothetical protein
MPQFKLYRLSIAESPELLNGDKWNFCRGTGDSIEFGTDNNGRRDPYHMCPYTGKCLRRRRYYITPKRQYPPTTLFVDGVIKQITAVNLIITCTELVK